MKKCDLSGSSETAYLDKCEAYSEAGLSDLRDKLSKTTPQGYGVVTFGSFARREACESSDLDYIIIRGEGVDPANVIDTRPIVDAIKSVVAKAPSPSGSFAGVESEAAFYTNLGGNSDTNETITRRVLFLLEGEYLSNEPLVRALRRKIIEKYVAEGITNYQLALFLLNDIIRYYRTIAVDYEFKTIEDQAPKPWGIRNIKLVFSRKLLYASGLFSVGQTNDRTREEKVQILNDLLSVSPLERMNQICGRSRTESLRSSYDYFLENMSKPDIRRHLEGLRRDQREDAVFRKLKNEGHRFTRELLKLFEATFDATHPIRRAVLF